MSRRLALTLGGALLVLAVLAAAVPQPALAQAPDADPAPAIEGALPVEGGTALVSVGADLAPEALVEAVREAGCHLESLAVASGGRLVPYVPGAPAFVNAGFPSPVAAGTALAVRCARPPLDTPDLHLLTLVTKEHALPDGFVPDGLLPLSADLVMPGGGTPYLVDEAAEALREMLEAASAEGHTLAVRSAYRSHAEQTATFGYWVALLGEEEASRRSARPGHSEHQLGTVVDVTSPGMGWELEPALGDAPEGQWLARRAWRYGFVESYPAEGEAVTGYAYEPWHLRYIGTTHAAWLRTTGLTLTEYLEELWAD